MQHLQHSCRRLRRDVASYKNIASTRTGVSRTDVIVCVICILLLSAINGPWLSSVALEASRKRTCQNNLRQIGLGLQAYHDVAGTLPPAATWTYDGLDMKQFFWDKEKPRSPEVSRANWLQLLLPVLGNESLSHQFSLDQSIFHPQNKGGRQTEVPQFKCPSDEMNRANNHFRYTLTDGTVASFSRGNYAINGGGQWIFKSPGVLFNPRPNASNFFFDEDARYFEFWGTGVAGFNRCFSYRDFRNGLSSTVAVDEIRAGISPEDTRGVWALGQIGASVTWGHGIVGDAGAPNIAIDDSDDILGCRDLHQKHGAAWLRDQGMPCCKHCNQNQQAAARSRHPGGVNVLMIDGSVRFISDSVDRGLWDAIHSRESPGDDFAGGLDVPLSGADEGFRNEVGSHRNSGDQLGELSEKEVTNSVGMKFVRIPAGEFEMGIPNEGFQQIPENSPPHRVVISRDYYLGKFEVTQEQFSRVMGAHSSWHSADGDGSELMAGRDTKNHPAEQITWHQALEFCQRLSEQPEEMAKHRAYRLPTEAEWEYGCRGGRTGPIRLQPYWDDTDKSGEFASKQLREDGRVMVTEPVGSYPANPYGLCDMCGNVFEWCSDWYGFDYYQRSPKIDPQGPEKGYFKIIRGWYWVYTGPSRKDNQATSPWRSSPYIGFRAVCETNAN
jgi:prepilin-type processing-associated H-X9-DG protein